jgi:hypothetical protein
MAGGADGVRVTIGRDRIGAVLLLVLLATTALLPLPARSESLAASGCPMFHCTVEATSVVAAGVVPAIPDSNNNAALGALLYQGCSGNGTVLTCLYSTDSASGTSAGTLKVLNATTLQPIWGSAGTPGSYNPSASAAADGQLPVNFADGTFSAGDNSYYVHYSAAGAVLGKAALTGAGSDFGMTPISSTYGVVSQTNGVLTLIDLATWTSVDSVRLSAPHSNDPIKIVSPSSGAPGVVYVVGYDATTGDGYLYAIRVKAGTTQLVATSVYPFLGSSGASPVVVLPSISGLANNLVLLAAPGLNGAPLGQSYLAAVLDVTTSTGLALAWSIPVAAPLIVTPTLDPSSGSLFYTVPGSPDLYQASIQTGTPIAAFNLQTIGGFPKQFQLSGHLNSNVAASATTILLGAVVTPTGTAPSTLYAIAFQPATGALLWPAQALAKTNVPLSTSYVNIYTAAWNYAPSTQPGIDCVIAIAVEGDDLSKIVRLCDH